MPEFMPKLPFAHALPALPAIFFAAVPVLSGVLGVVLAHPHFSLSGFATHAFTLVRLTWHCSGSASPPNEFRR